ncbi:MAG: fliI, partial [Alphaproteobacteria bacterium]|nr:fliI [Alphaproteobacteria bacterium]
MHSLALSAASIRGLNPDRRFGRVVAVRGALLEVEGLAGAAQIGSRVQVRTADDIVDAEVTGLDRGVAHCLPFSDPKGVTSGSRADLVSGQLSLRPCNAWLGRMVDGLGRPV